MKDDLFLFISFASVMAAFLLVSLIVYLTKGNAHFIDKRIKLDVFLSVNY